MKDSYVVLILLYLWYVLRWNREMPFKLFFQAVCYEQTDYTGIIS